MNEMGSSHLRSLLYRKRMPGPSVQPLSLFSGGRFCPHGTKQYLQVKSSNLSGFLLHVYKMGCASLGDHIIIFEIPLSG